MKQVLCHPGGWRDRSCTDVSRSGSQRNILRIAYETSLTTAEVLKMIGHPSSLRKRKGGREENIARGFSSGLKWSFQACSFLSPWNGTYAGPTAAVEGAPPLVSKCDQSRVRTPGAKDQRGCQFIPLACAWLCILPRIRFCARCSCRLRFVFVVASLRTVPRRCT